MSSEISRTLAAYRAALSASRSRYEEMYRDRGSNALDFYKEFAHNLVRPFGNHVSDVGTRRRLHRLIRQAFGTDAIDFVAIDGSCNKDQFSDFVTFSACAYGAKGQLTLNESGDRPLLKYLRWELNRDVSMVAYVPVPFAQLADALGDRETFLASDADRVHMASAHVKLMQLGEIFLGYSVAVSSSIERPKLILLDLLPSSVLASIATKAEEVRLIGYRYDRRSLDYRDIVVAMAHPFSTELRQPASNRFRLHQLIIAALHRTGRSQVDLEKLASEEGVDVSHLRTAAAGSPLFGNVERFEETSRGLYDRDRNELLHGTASLGRLRGNLFEAGWSENGKWTAFDVRASWQFTLSLFRHLCDRLFREKAPNAMIYEAEGADGVMREHWLDPIDIEFLVAVGTRALIEACWTGGTALIGLAKDSASKYFSRNYVGVLKHALQLPKLKDLEVGRLPWTDRMFLEFVATNVDDLAAPWSTVEFDSAFMTLWVAAIDATDPASDLTIGAPGGFIVANTGLFARSLSQFFISRAKRTPLMGHVVFVDRLLLPGTDTGIPTLDLSASAIARAGFREHDLGRLRVVGITDNETDNSGQDIALYLLASLTRNHYPEVIGYPDPLHKADWGAKTLGDRLRSTIRSSEIAFAAKPLVKTLRSIRDSHRR